MRRTDALVLIVEDSPTQANKLLALLEAEKCQAVIAGSPLTAVKYLSKCNEGSFGSSVL